MKGDFCSYKICGKKAIGYEYCGGNMWLNVCEDHASFILKKLQPGQKCGEGKDYHHRYEVD